jgi:SAM-dependent methyltransferase
MVLINNREYIRKMFFGGEALELTLRSLSQFSNVLDIGVGRGDHALVMLKEGHTVSGVDVGSRVKEEVASHAKFSFKHAYFEQFIPEDPFDCIWASHVLEHILNPGQFLKRCYEFLEEDGIFAVTVPPLKHNIVGGHVSLWNPGLLLYHLILAGFDCSEAAVKTYGYNISVVVRKKPRELVHLKHDAGDIDLLAPFFPRGLDAKESFNGNIQELNWSTL